MSKTTRNWFWLKWPEHKQKRFMGMTRWLAVVLMLCVFGPQYFMTVATQKEIVRKRELYARVVPVVQNIKRLRARQIMNAETLRSAVLKIAEGAGIGWDQLSLQEEPFEYGEPGVLVELQGVTLVQLTAFLETSRKQADLRFLSFDMERDAEQSVLADVKTLLVR